MDESKPTPTLRRDHLDGYGFIAGIFVVSIGCYFVSLLLPVGGWVEGDRSIIGIVVLFLGWLVIPLFGPYWLANLMLFFSWRALFARRSYLAIIWSISAVAMTSSIFVYLPESIEGIARTTAYWLWLISMILALYAAIVSALIKQAKFIVLYSAVAAVGLISFTHFLLLSVDAPDKRSIKERWSDKLDLEDVLYSRSWGDGHVWRDGSACSFLALKLKPGPLFKASETNADGYSSAYFQGFDAGIRGRWQQGPLYGSGPHKNLDGAVRLRRCLDSMPYGSWKIKSAFIKEIQNTDNWYSSTNFSTASSLNVYVPKTTTYYQFSWVHQ